MDIIEKITGKKAKTEKAASKGVGFEDLGETPAVEKKTTEAKPKAATKTFAAYRILAGPTRWGTKKQMEEFVERSGGPQNYVIREFPI